MKIKNLKSVVHNFADSLQSLDYRICELLIFDEILQLYDQFGIDTVRFDFINGTVKPDEANNKKIFKILNNYKSWLPELCKSQNCEIESLDRLTVDVNVDFRSIFQPPGMSDTVQISIKTNAHYKISERREKIITLNIDELVKKRNFPKGLRVKISQLKL